jgi:exosortase/archaeosortase family protein
MAKSNLQPKRKRSGAENALPGGATASSEGRSGRFRFAVPFSLSCLWFYALIFTLPDRYTAFINKHTARTLGYVLNMLGIPVSVLGDGVWGKGLAVTIILECTAFLMVGLFLSFVIFYPAPARKKGAGLLVGIPALYLGNLIRLILVFVAGRYGRILFDILHAFLGQVFTITLVFISCVLWLRWLDREDSKKGIPLRVASFLARFTLISVALFFLWMEIHHAYIWFVDRFMILGFSLFNYRLFISREIHLYYETFNMVTFTSLVLATRCIPWLGKVKGLAMGLGILFLLHLFHRIDNVFIASFHFIPVITADYILCAVGQYLLPLLLYLAVIRWKSPPDIPWQFCI